jgi:hypothetical protein
MTALLANAAVIFFAFAAAAWIADRPGQTPTAENFKGDDEIG